MVRTNRGVFLQWSAWPLPTICVRLCGHALGPTATGIDAKHTLFVSCNAWDALAATWFGYRTLWVNRYQLPFEELDTQPAHTGSTLRTRPPKFKNEIARQLEEKVWPLIAAGQIKTMVNAVFPLAEAAKAHALMESSTHIGKILLTLE